MRVIFTCGGTAGHVNPALALAGLLRERRLEETLRLGLLAHPGLERALLKKALEGLDCRELEEWEAALRKAAARRLPVGERPLVQTAPEESPREGEAGPQSNRQFMV